MAHEPGDDVAVNVPGVHRQIETYRVNLTFEVLARHYDPARFARVAANFADFLPSGSQTLSAKSGAEDGVADVVAKLPAAGLAQALRDVARAVELAVAQEVSGLDNLGPLRSAHVERTPD
jgi:hypothetical protein